jgi:hypothetical protein
VNDSRREKRRRIREGGQVDFAPQGGYQSSSLSTIIIFDLRCTSAVERLHRERAAWQADADIEALDEDHFVLVVRPGGAERRLAS